MQKKSTRLRKRSGALFFITNSQFKSVFFSQLEGSVEVEQVVAGAVVVGKGEGLPACACASAFQVPAGVVVPAVV